MYSSRSSAFKCYCASTPITLMSELHCHIWETNTNPTAYYEVTYNTRGAQAIMVSLNIIRKYFKIRNILAR